MDAIRFDFTAILAGQAAGAAFADEAMSRQEHAEGMTVALQRALVIGA